MRSEAETLPPTALEVREILSSGNPAGMPREQIKHEMAALGRSKNAATMGMHTLIRARQAHWVTWYREGLSPVDLLQLGPRPEDSTL